MGQPPPDRQRHFYADYLTWPDDVRYELIDGVAYPIDRIITIHRLEQGRFGKADVFELAGETPVGVLPGVVIVWDALVARLTPPQD